MEDALVSPRVALPPKGLVGERSQIADKSLAETLMSTLTTMKFDGSHTMNEHVIEITNIATRLKTLGMTVNENFLVHFILNSLLSEIDLSVATYLTTGRRRQMDKPKCSSPREKTRGVATNVYSRKMLEKPKREKRALGTMAVYPGEPKLTPEVTGSPRQASSFRLKSFGGLGEPEASLGEIGSMKFNEKTLLPLGPVKDKGRPFGFLTYRVRTSDLPLGSLEAHEWCLSSPQCRALRPRIFFINGFLCFLEDEWQRNGERKRERRRHFKEKMSLEEAHHHRRPWIRAWRKKEMNEGRGREEHEILCSK
ncbi:hypothetical protein HKD37_19G053461 [Glycine soja]